MGKLKNKLFNLGLSKGVNEIQEEKRVMKRAFSETYQVLQHTTRSIYRMIPKSFLDFLYENMDKTWSENMDFSKNLMAMDLLRETRILLSLVYRDFLCSEQERKMLVEKDRKEMETAGLVYDEESLKDLFDAED